MNRMRHLIDKLLLILLVTGQIWLAGHIAQADTTQEFPEDIAARLQTRYDAMASLSFTFNQNTKGQISGRPQTGSGQAFFSKSPNSSRMRWNYTSPNQQVLISDGTTFSMYFADLKQMIISPAETLDNELTYSFFSGRGNLKKDFHILPPNEEFITTKPSPDGVRIIKLVPKEQQSQVQNIHLWVTADSLIQRIEIRDHFDTLTDLILTDIKADSLNGKDQKSLDDLFSFSPPAGTEIIHQ
jgi:outer membrane lipoprotein carrier protein